MDRELLNDLISSIGKVAEPKYLHGLKEFIPGKTQLVYSGPYWDNQEIEAALHTFLTGSWLTTGTEVFKFQNQFAKKFNVQHAHMVNSGSSANLVMIAALKKCYGWKDGDEVIVSPVGFPTTIAPLVQNGLKPVFVDIEMDTLNFDLNEVSKVCNKNTKAIFVSPVLGNPPNMEFLTALQHGWLDYEGQEIMLIGDNCDSLGTRWGTRLITDYYNAWSTSFYPAHHITTGEGGMVCSNDEEVIKIARSISWWGRGCYCVGQANLLSCGTCGKRFDRWLDNVPDIIDHKYVFENMGYNLKPLDLQGAIGQVQLKKWDTIESKRRRNFWFIKDALKKIVGVRVANQLPQADPSWFGVPIICDTPQIKQSLVNHLEANKIQTRNYFAGNILLHPGYKHLDDANKYPNANMALSHVFFIGCPPFYDFDPHILYIDKMLNEWTSI